MIVPLAPQPHEKIQGAEPAQAADGRRSRLEPLAGLRIAAAVLVVAHHFLSVAIPSQAGPGQIMARAVRAIVAHGFVGVSFFFILSGFILAYTYLGHDGQFRGSRHDFWVARVARVYPAYLLGFVVAAPVYAYWRLHDCAGATALCQHNNPLITAVASLTLTQAFIPYTEPFWNPPSWSLSAEAFFYLLFPVIGVALARLERRYLYAVLGACAVMSLAMALAYLALLPDGTRYTTRSWLDDAFWLRILYCDPVFRLQEFIAGVALGVLFLRRRTGVYRRRRTPRPGTLAAVALLGIVVVLSLGRVRLQLLEAALLDPLFALLIYSVAFEEGVVAALFSLPIIVQLGEASYAVYILHNPLWRYTTSTLRYLLGPTRVAALSASPAFFLAYLGVVIGASILCLRVVEQPARRTIRRALSHRAPTPAPVVAPSSRE